MEIDIDQAISNIIARREPTARDLRLLMAVSKAVANLERAGDEARKIAKRTRRIAEGGSTRPVNIAEIKLPGEMATSVLRRGLDGFARLDVVAAAHIIRDDDAIDDEFGAFARKLVTYMLEDPRTIPIGLDYLFIAKAIERIGDHAQNLAEFVIYVVKGTDVRHVSREQPEREALGWTDIQGRRDTNQYLDCRRRDETAISEFLAVDAMHFVLHIEHEREALRRRQSQ